MSNLEHKDWYSYCDVRYQVFDFYKTHLVEELSSRHGTWLMLYAILEAIIKNGSFYGDSIGFYTRSNLIMYARKLLDMKPIVTLKPNASMVIPLLKRLGIEQSVIELLEKESYG